MSEKCEKCGGNMLEIYETFDPENGEGRVATIDHTPGGVACIRNQLATALQERDEARAEVERLSKDVADISQYASFCRSCALSGETPDSFNDFLSRVEMCKRMNDAPTRRTAMAEQRGSQTTEGVVSQLRERDKLGLQKYGVTLDDTPCSIKQLLQHAQEEAMDLACYLEIIKARLSALEEKPKAERTDGWHSEL